MGVEKVKPEGGKGGKLGRSNMAYWGTNDEVKVAARTVRRVANKVAVVEGSKDAEDQIPASESIAQQGQRRF